MAISNNLYILKIDRHTYGRLDGHTDIWISGWTPDIRHE